VNESLKPGQSGQITKLLVKLGDGDQRALDALTPLVYQQLRQVGGACAASVQDIRSTARRSSTRSI
jgi:hypothetical protein